MATTKQRAAACKNIKEAATTAARNRRTIAHLPSRFVSRWARGGRPPHGRSAHNNGAYAIGIIRDIWSDEPFRWLDAKKSGKLRSIGFTGHRSPPIHLHMLETADKHGFSFDAVQIREPPMKTSTTRKSSSISPICPENRIRDP